MSAGLKQVIQMPKQYHCRVYWHAEPPLPGYLRLYCSAHHAVRKVRTVRDCERADWVGGGGERERERAIEREREREII